MEQSPNIDVVQALAALSDVIIHAAQKGAFLSRTITTRDGSEPYLTRYLLSAGPDDFPGLLKLFGKTPEEAGDVHRRERGLIYLHHIHRADDDLCLHTHPWEGTSYILRGGYREMVATLMHCGGPKEGRALDSDDGLFDGRNYLARPFRASHKQGSVNFISRIYPHRITEVEPDTWTLVRTSNRVSSWGFMRPVKPPANPDTQLTYEAECVDWKRYFRELGTAL